MRRISFLLFLLFLLPFSGRAQQKHDALREIYLRLVSDSTKLDSALTYSFKVRNAAVKEFGNTSMPYFRALNNIGHTYNQQKRYRKSRSWWLKAYKEFRNIDQKDFLKTTASIYNNLKVTYLFNFPKADSATFFADKFLAVNQKVHGGNSRVYLNKVSNLAADFENVFGLKHARKYYNKALDVREKLFGRRSKEIIAGLDSLISISKKSNDAESRFAIYSTLDSAYTLASLDSISKSELRKNDSWDCIYYSREMMDVALQQQGDTSAKFFVGLDRFGLACQNILREDSIPIFCLKKGMTILKSQQREKSKSYVALLRDLALTYYSIGRYDQAVLFGHKRLKVVEAFYGSESDEYASALNDLGNSYKDSDFRDESNFRKASSFLNQSLALHKRISGEESEEYALNLIDLGGANIRWAMLDSAAYFYENAYKIFQTKNRPDKIYEIARQINYVYGYKEDFAKANQWLQKCIDLKKNANDTLNQDYVFLLRVIAGRYLSKKRWNETSVILNQMESILDKINKKTDDPYLNYLSLKASYFTETGRYDEADPLLTFVLNISSDNAYYDQKSKNTIEPIVGLYSGKADNFFRQGEYEKARSAKNKAIAILLRLGHKKDTPRVSTHYWELAKIMDHLGRNDSAVFYYHEALKGYSDPIWKHDLSLQQIKIDLATQLWKMGNLSEAEKLMADGSAKLKESMVSNMAGYSEKEKQQYNSALQQSLFKYYSLQRTLSGTHPEVNSMAYNFLLQSKGLLLNTSDYLGKAIAASADTSMHNRLAKLKNLRLQLAQAYQQREEEPGQAVISIGKLEAEAEKTEQLLSFNSPAFADFQKHNSLTFKEVKQSLSPKEAAIEFVAFPYSDFSKTTDSVVYGAFVVTAKAESPAYIPLANNAVYKELVRGQGTNGRGATVISTVQNSSRNSTLYQQLWQPLLPYLNETEKVYIASDGVLNNVSFASLRDSTNQYLIDKYELHFILSSKDIAKTKSAQLTENKPKVALFGGAKYSLENENVATDSLLAERSLPRGLRGGSAWNYLPNTLTEVKNIQKILKRKRWQVQNFNGETASEANFKGLSGPQAPSVLHIATHGFYFPIVAGQAAHKGALRGEVLYNENENPLLRTGLVFSAANAAWLGHPVKSGTDDGILTAFEFANMDLSKTELVVLSACETGVGDVLNGEGVFGLQRAIRQAGIGKMIVSLWPVPDKETSEMMQEFYRTLAKENNVVTAFRKAQSSMRGKYANNPVLWAGFVLIE